MSNTYKQAFTGGFPKNDVMNAQPFWSLLLGLNLLLFVAACGDKFDDEVDPGNPFSEAEDALGQWTWIPVSDMVCRDLSTTGIGVRLQADATKLLIYLEGGGACFNDFTCNSNPASFGNNAFFLWNVGVGSQGIFDIDRAENPVQDWNMVYIPYCSGDLHGGVNPNTQDLKNFVGFENVRQALDLIGPYFSGAETVLLTGSSAGGVGTFFNFEQVHSAFSGAAVHLLNDSGPFLEEDSVLAPCLQQVWRDEFNLSIPTACSNCVTMSGDGLEAFYNYFATTYPNSEFGLVCYKEDGVLRNFLGYSQDECSLLDGGFPQLPNGLFTDALTELRDNVLEPAGNWSTFYLDGADHVLLGNNKLYNEQAGGKTIAAWLGDLLDGTVQQLEQ